MTYIHTHALVESDAVGEGTKIWAFVHVLKGATIGQDCNICDHCFIESGVTIGNSVTLKSGIYLWSGATIGNNAFLGPNVVFTNDLHPRSKNVNYKLLPIEVKEWASIGANATILAGTTIGRYALVGIGAVVTRNVKDYALVYGNPARQHGWVDEYGTKLTLEEATGYWVSATGKRYLETKEGLTPAQDA